MSTLDVLPNELLQDIILRCTKWDRINIAPADRCLGGNARIADKTLHLYPDEETISAALHVLSSFSSHVADSIQILELSWDAERSSRDLRPRVEHARAKDTTDQHREPLDLCGELTHLFKQCRNINRLTVEGASPKPVLNRAPARFQTIYDSIREENKEREEQAAALLPEIIRAAKEGSAEITSLVLTRVQVHKLVVKADWQAQLKASCGKLQKLEVQSFQSGSASARFLKRLTSFSSIQSLRIGGPSGLDNPVPFPYPGRCLGATGVKQIFLTGFSIAMEELKDFLSNFRTLDSVVLQDIGAVYGRENGHDYRDLISHLEDGGTARVSREQGSSGCNGKYTIARTSGGI